MEKDFNVLEQLEMKLWCDTYVGVASSGNCVDKKTPRIWADIALENFKEKFSQKFVERNDMRIKELSDTE